MTEQETSHTTTDSSSNSNSKFTPKIPVKLNPPDFTTKFSKTELLQYNGKSPEVDYKRYIAIKNHIFDVTSNEQMYGDGKSYSVFCGYDCSRALGLSSLKKQDIVDKCGQFDDYTERQWKVLNDWYLFFEKRYNIVGVLQDDTK
ncbi:hypothetical protein WICPIJ_000467 [Wickerhamomyces pijperi]|uniref:Cytochrome b5 heme-binding domain-containing protein n=1 Tax=Wickerhamomyces pijperi TaxID=599730 RepID=A0A9P8TRS4_WICPI|nr:hypothetical protein WICPIJ_000467 [Wickerhamomyces pijperi]